MDEYDCNSKKSVGGRRSRSFAEDGNSFEAPQHFNLIDSETVSESNHPAYSNLTSIQYRDRLSFPRNWGEY